MTGETLCRMLGGVDDLVMTEADWWSALHDSDARWRTAHTIQWCANQRLPSGEPSRCESGAGVPAIEPGDAVLRHGGGVRGGAPDSSSLSVVRAAAVDVSAIRDADWVRERLGAGDTVSNIAVAAGVSRQTAHTWIQRHRLPPRTPARPSDARLHVLYGEHGSIGRVALQLEMPAATVHRWLIAAGVTLRRPGAPTRSIDA